MKFFKLGYCNWFIKLQNVNCWIVNLIFLKVLNYNANSDTSKYV